MSRRWRDPLVSRRRRLEAPWIPPASPAAPQMPPQTLATKRRLPPARHGRSFFAPSAGDLQLTLPLRRRPVAVRRRGSMFETPWAPQVVPAAPTFVPDELQRSVRMVTVRRGRFAAPPWPQQQATAPPDMPPSFVRQNAMRARPQRRGRFLPSLAAAPGIPQRLRLTVRRQLPGRRGKFSRPLPVVSLAGPGPLVPKLSRSTQRRLVIPRRGHFLAVPLIGATPASPGFVCQDFDATVSVDAYSGSVSVDAYAAAISVDAYSATVSVDTYGGTATNCGR